MNHAAKMILVPADTAIGTSAITAGNIDKSLPCDGDMFKKTKTVQTPGTYESRLDAEMADILQSDKEEFEKSILYKQIFQRFLQHRASTSVDQNLKAEKLQHEVEEMEAARNFDDNHRKASVTTQEISRKSQKFFNVCTKSLFC